MCDELLLWGNDCSLNEKGSTLRIFHPAKRTSDCIALIFAGGAYAFRSPHEDVGYAEFLAENGVLSAVVDYRVRPNEFPTTLSDAQRAVQTVRYMADSLGIDKNKIVVMGSSAGGHLAALVSTYNKLVYEGRDEISKQDFKPNAQVLCYPVISFTNDSITHHDTVKNFLGNSIITKEEVSPDLIADEKTPQAFIWHTFTDEGVSVLNSIEYFKALKSKNVNCEMHIFPEGGHGYGLFCGEDRVAKHNSKWSDMLLAWLRFINFL